MMSAKIRLLKSNINKNKSAKLFFKTMSSKFFHKAKSPKMTDVTLTKSTTKFSENNLTKTIYSSKYKEEPLFMSLQDFHKNFVLNKNNNYDNNKRLINLRKYSLSPSLNFSSSETKSGIIPNNQRNTINALSKKDNDISKINAYSFFTFYDINEIKEKNDKNIKNIFNRNKKNFYTKNIKTFQNNIMQTELFDSENKKNNKIIRNSHVYKIRGDINTLNNLNNVDILNKIFSSKEKDNNNEIHFKNENKNEKIKLYYNRNTPKLVDQFAYPNYHFSERIETFKEFFYKTKINIFNNYRKYLNKNTYLKYAMKINFEIDREILLERNMKNFEKLFTVYQKSLEEYIQFLQKKIREIQEENSILLKTRFKLELDNEKIKIDIIEDMNKIREGFTIKYFLTCVKNHTLSPEKFSPEDYKEIEQEKLKLNENYYLSLIRNKKRRNSYKKPSVSNIFLNNNQVRKIQEHSLTRKLNKQLSGKNNPNSKDKVKKAFLKKNTKNITILPILKSFKVLETMEEFIQNIDMLSSSVYNLIIDSTNKYYRNIFLKIELENITKKSSNIINNSNYWQGQISLYEKTLHGLKSKNNTLVKSLNNLKEHQFQNDIKILLVIKNIKKVYYNLKREDNSVINITKEMIELYGDEYYLKIIEQYLCELLLKIDELKKRSPSDYKIFKTKLHKHQKKRDYYKYQKFLLDKVQIKLDKVLQKAEKVIYKRRKKTYDYKKTNKKIKIKKKEIQKTELEVFEEFLEDESF